MASSSSDLTPEMLLRNIRDFQGSSSQGVTYESINENLRKATYAVRGAIVEQANALKAKLEKGEDLPFDTMLYCNLGNPQAVQQPPITFTRQVMALLEYPPLIEDPRARDLFPEDVIQRAITLRDALPGGLGAYSDSRGHRHIRQNVASFIEKRDGFPCDPDAVFLSDGATPSITRVMQMLLRDGDDAIMIPIPTYPLYTACLTLMGGAGCFYHLDEDKNWSLTIEELQLRLEEGRGKGKNVRALVIINPGNPAGNVLSHENMQEIIRFCAREQVALLADEVYQPNIYSEDLPFISFKQVLCEMIEEAPNVQLFSFHSTSKGYTGECGKRGGFVELFNVSEKVLAEYNKFCSLSLCSNLTGQVSVDLAVKPPQEGDPSYSLFQQERDAILGSLKRKAVTLVDAFQSMEGFSCNSPQGALYAFPRIVLPEKLVAEAEAKGVKPDFLYCSKLLDQTGIVVVPGSGFMQRDGTYHFRTTFLPREDLIPGVVEKLKTFHAAFMEQYRD